LPYGRKNIFLEIEYDGSPFFGWQRQTNVPTVQGTIEETLSKVMGRKVVIYGASRTDTGVHALGQGANFWGDSRFEEHQWRLVLNSQLPQSIRIVRSKVVPDSFHAQRFAISKIYQYRVLNRDYGSALDRTVFFYHRKLDWEKIRKCLPYFLGEHDFAAFQGAKATVKSTVRTIHRFELEAQASGLHIFTVEGNGFLKQMVRAMVGTLLEVGEGRREPESIVDIIRGRDRKLAGRTVAPQGLCLVKVKYPM
jgi:tRNA pseudouridine38-40 synthase